MSDTHPVAGQGRISPYVALVSLAERYRTVPFGAGDTTAGVENEMQAVVLGPAEQVDLPRTIRASNYYANCLKRAAAGTIPKSRVALLEHYLDRAPQGVWENSWVRFPAATLGAEARDTFATDLLADKRRPEAGRRQDADHFFCQEGADDWIRIPISYLLKLALADTLEGVPPGANSVRETGHRLLSHFSNDNTSPETHSFHVVPLRPEAGNGQAAAREMAKRFLLTQLLTMYANGKFGLAEHGQRALVYFAPHPPVRQRELNEIVPDAFYRELFMSPCLSGWDQGEVKLRYMHLCHEVLSRSQLNAVAKLREAGIITRNLVVLPATSNVSLANNGTHVSLGSRLLSRALADPGSHFGPAEEKCLGDLVIKVVEHFLPLFVGTYSAAPYRLDFADFHPERVLGFLPHELDYSHLRMLWRRWKKKASLRVFGRPVTPFGPRRLDQAFARAFGLRGDLVPDFRLIDYLVALLSTDQSPGLDGRPGNLERLKRDLTDLGVFDQRMAAYLPYRLREHRALGFSGFEGRHYSLFLGFSEDLGRAVDLQHLVTALAIQYAARGLVNHAGIPDDPTVESERRQPLFAAALGLPTFFVAAETPNLFLRRVLERTDRVRASHRQTGYLRIRTEEYRRALLQQLRQDGGELAEALGLESALTDLALRLLYPDEASVVARLLQAVLRKTGASTPLALGARDFNAAAEAYYREDLRAAQLAEAADLLSADLRALEQAAGGDEQVRTALHAVAGEEGAEACLARRREDLVTERLPIAELKRLIFLVLISVEADAREAEGRLDEQQRVVGGATPVR